jgi:hypothetical protein
MKRSMLLLVGVILMVTVITGCSTTGTGTGTNPNFTQDDGLSAKERARRAAAIAHPGGPPYSYSWTETVIIDGVEHVKQGTAFVVPE